MAQGTSNGIEPYGLFPRTKLKPPPSCQSHPCVKYKVVTSENFIHRYRELSNHLYLQHVDLLKHDINRILTESIHCDLKIVYGFKTLYTNQCILRVRSPLLFKILSQCFHQEKESTSYFIQTFEVYRQIKNFIRLLYTDLDITHYEQFLVQLIIDETYSFCNHSSRVSQRGSVENEFHLFSMNRYLSDNIAAKNLNERSPTASDMADSGLESGVETGSLVSPQETLSENSSTDLDEPNDSSRSKRNIRNDFQDHKNSLRDLTLVRNDVSTYPNLVFSDQFPETIHKNKQGNRSNTYTPSTSLEFAGINSTLLNKCKGERIIQNGKKPNIAVEHVDEDDSSNSNFYFIDASSLNDDLEEASTNVAGYPRDARSNWSNSQLPGGCYIPKSKSKDLTSNDDTSKLAQRRKTNVQNCYEDVELKQDAKSPENLDSSFLKKFDLTPNDSSSCKSSNKESLAVEIKEADSGESALHSPCPDNTKINNVQKVQEKLTSLELKQPEGEFKQEEEEEKEEEEEEGEKRPPLIRRNTFELDANDEKLSTLRQEYERRQGTLVFQNSITQYSQHHIDEDSYFNAVNPLETAIVKNIDFVPEADSQASLASNYVLDKYDLDTTEKERIANRQLSNIYDKSAVHSISRSASDKLLTDYHADDPLSYSSLPVHINDEFSLCPVKLKLRRNEAAPIVSGGASSSDFHKPPDSPVIKRKTESTPIVSGGSVIMHEPEMKESPKARNSNMSSLMSSNSAWVVDMSDCRAGNGEKNIAPRKLNEVPSASKTSLDRERDRSQPSSLGYFVNLDDIKSPKDRPKDGPGTKHKRRPSDSASEKSYCEFFIDLSDTRTEQQKKAEQNTSSPGSSEVPTSASSQASDGKKNMFSMFIDLSEPTGKTGFCKSSSSSKLAEKRFELNSQRRASEDQQQPERKPRSGVFMFIESDSQSPLVRRRTLSSSRPAFKRHSWNTDKSNEQTPSTSEQPTPVAPKRPLPTHKRAHSLSVERTQPEYTKQISLEAQSRLEKKILSLSVEQERHPDEMLEYDSRDTPPNSHVEIINEELITTLKKRNKEGHEKQQNNAHEHTNSETSKTTSITHQDEGCSESTETIETRKSETFDISSSASGPSSTSDNLDFKLNGLLDATQHKLVVSSETAKNHEDNRLKHNSINEKVNKTNLAKVTPASFVRLSDLDSRPLSNSTISSVRTSAHESSYRLSKSVTETSWIESKLAMSSKISEPLHRTFAKRLPLSLATGLSKSEFEEFGNEGDAEGVVSESDLSSLQSSMGRSGQGSTTETETSTSFAMGRPYNRLGEDLLRMFLEEINPDVTIDVGGRRIRAHKCILSSRCQYFAAILSGGWIESAGNVISLQGYSHDAVHFALCHIYSGESCIPDTISIVELATLADMLCLEGLKEVIAFTLKVKYCHLFHKPCNGCAAGVLECMPLAAAYGLDEIYRKSLKWVTRHFVRIWPTKEFATLPRELMDKCYHQHIVHMSTENVLLTIMDCDKLLTTLPNVRWAEPVFRLVSNLVDVSMKYLTDNFSGLLGSESFHGLDRELTWNISRLEDHLLAAAERLPPEQACKAYSRLDKMFTITHIEDTQRSKPKWSPLFADLMNKIRGQVEKSLIRDAARAARTNAWLKMDLELRRRIQELACLVIMPNSDSMKRPSRHSNFLKEPKERQESKVPVSRTPPNRNLDLRRVKMAISEHNDRTLKHTPLLQTRKIMNKPKTDPLERKMHTDKLSTEMTTVSRPKSWPNKIEVKSRYLEPRIRLIKETALHAPQDKTLGQQRKKIMISSSDSSRTSSPAMKRAAERKSLTKVSKVPIKKDGKALSSDSLTGSNSRLSVKKDIASKSCGITRPESPSLKTKDNEAGLSIDSLADPKKKVLIRKPNKMDTSMSADSLMTDITAITTPKSMVTNKSSPILGKALVNATINHTRNYDPLKKSSSPVQQRNTPLAMRRPTRSLESSTAASRSRAAAVVSTYQGSLNLRRSLLDAAKAPDIPSKTINTVGITRSSLRQSTMKSSFGVSNKTDKRKDESSTNNQRSNSSPGSKRSPKTNANSRLSKSTTLYSKQKANKSEDKSCNKAKSQSTFGADGPKFLNQSSRSGTFSKDEPTILNKSDIETAAIDV